MKFVIQTVNGICKLDLCQAMQNSMEFDNWKLQSNIESAIYCDINDVEKYVSKEYCPVGTLEFFFKYYDCLFGSHNDVKPLNVPEWCHDFTGNVYNIIDSGNIPDIEISENNRMFMKSLNEFKSQINGFIQSKNEIADNVQLTCEEQIVSEWRIFVHNGKFIDIKNYSGDPFSFPDIDTIFKIEKKVPFRFEGTVDVMVTEDGYTKVIECHEFFSCGLYGFSDYNVLPSMLWRTWIKLIKNK